MAHFIPRKLQCYRFCLSRSHQNCFIFKVTESIVHNVLNPCFMLLNYSCEANIEVFYNSCQHLCRYSFDFSFDAFFEVFICSWVACIYSLFQISPKEIICQTYLVCIEARDCLCHEKEVRHLESVFSSIQELCLRNEVVPHLAERQLCGC